MTDEKKKILIVEDETTLVDMYKMQFEQSNYQILTAGDGVLATEIAIKEVPDLILLDLGVPKKDGYQVIQDLKKEPQTKDVPIIIFSNAGQQEEIDRGMKLGAVDHLVKANLTPAQVVEKVTAFFTKNTAK